MGSWLSTTHDDEPADKMAIQCLAKWISEKIRANSQSQWYRYACKCDHSIYLTEPSIVYNAPSFIHFDYKTKEFYIDDHPETTYGRLTDPAINVAVAYVLSQHRDEFQRKCEEEIRRMKLPGHYQVKVTETTCSYTGIRRQDVVVHCRDPPNCTIDHSRY